MAAIRNYIFNKFTFLGHRRHVTQESHKQLAVVYSQLYAAVTTVSNGYEAGTLNKTPEQISQLLQL